MEILLSLKPEYSDKIFSGEKKFEFRKRKPKHAFEVVLVYESHPTKKIVGKFSVKKIISGSPRDVWKMCRKLGGIGKNDFFEYCGNEKTIYAFEIDKALRFDSPVDPSNLNPKFNPPQSFTYLNKSLLRAINLGLNEANRFSDEFLSLINF